MKFIWNFLQNVSPMTKVGLLWNFRQIGTSQSPELLEQYKPQLIQMKKIPALKETITNLIDVMEGRTLVADRNRGVAGGGA